MKSPKAALCRKNVCHSALLKVWYFLPRFGGVSFSHDLLLMSNSRPSTVGFLCSQTGSMQVHKGQGVTEGRKLAPLCLQLPQGKKSW